MKEKEIQITVGLVQIGDRYGDQYYLPYSIGLLQAYAQEKLKNPEHYHFLLPIYKKGDIERDSEQLAAADIVFFSVYDWNFRISLELARRLKGRSPSTVVVFGGPQISEDPGQLEKLLKENPFIDLGCCGEGEQVFLKILENLMDCLWEKVPSIGFLGKDGRLILNQSSGRMINLNDIPSPYLKGVFDPLIAANPNEKWSALIETNRGCPFTCAYCYWGEKARNKIYQFDLDRVFSEIDWISRNRIEFVFCCDANFGIFKRDKEIALKVAANKEKFGYPQAFSVQNTKNSTAEIFELQKILNDAGLQKGVNLALQSVNPETLKSINRSNISNRTYMELQHLFTENNISTFSDMILALPNESYHSFADGVTRMIGSGQHNRIQFINLSILNNTEMAKAEYQKEYGLKIAESINSPHHTSLADASEILEKQYLVVGTGSLPPQDWIKTRVFCWVTSLLYFNKLLQIVFLMLNRVGGIDFRELIELFMKEEGGGTIKEIRDLFIGKAEEIQQGGSEHFAAPDWLNIWWPADEYVFIKLCRENALADFYAEAQAILGKYLKEKKADLPSGLLDDAIRLNRELIKKPFVSEDLDLEVNSNIYEVYRQALKGKESPLKAEKRRHTIDRSSRRWQTWDDWCREVVWYGTKKGDYLYACN